AVLAPLSTAQMTTPGVNGQWSIKDNIAHLNAWHRRLLNMLQATKEGVDLPDPTPGQTEEEINEMFYQQNKDRSLAEVLAEFHSTYQQILQSVQALSNEELNKPLSWLEGGSVGPFVAGNTYEHYQEHAQIIQGWLASSND
ncbi:MAG: ClbS/DfsB family four-helix bundle protein, partial [Chloroflexi bacterium]|nr:ClbS/DfsB family four-helix bundle protein [Chloroflexota bacterium]